MKTICLAILMLFVATAVHAQCVAEIKDVIQDEIRGSIIVQTEYVLNGEVVQQGQTRYLETSGTEAEIEEKAKEDGVIHCKNLVRRIEANAEYLRTEKLVIQKSLTAPLITNLKAKLVGYKSEAVTEVVDTFKGKDIKVTYDSKNIVSNTVVVIP